MSTDIFNGKWEEIKGLIKQTWGKLTEDDFVEIECDKHMIYSKLQSYYGYSSEQAIKAINEFNIMVSGEGSRI